MFASAGPVQGFDRWVPLWTQIPYLHALLGFLSFALPRMNTAFVFEHIMISYHFVIRYLDEAEDLTSTTKVCGYGTDDFPAFFTRGDLEAE